MKIIQSKRGYIYVASNKAMPGLVKIGMTTKNPRERLKELYTTGVPVPFSLIFEQRVKDPHLAEKVLHHKLASYRVTKKREFFEIDAGSAVSLTGRTLSSLHTVERSRRWIGWLIFLTLAAITLYVMLQTGTLSEIHQWREGLRN